MNPDDEDAKKDDHGEELTGMYANGCSSLEAARLSEEQAQAQRAAALAQDSRVPPRSQSPAFNTSDEDTLEEPEYKWSQTKGIQRKNKAWIRRAAAHALALLAPDLVRKPTPVPSDDENWSWMTDDQRRKAETAKDMITKSTPAKAAAPPRAPSAPSAGFPKQAPIDTTASPKSPTKKVSTATPARTKAVASQKAPADQPKGAKAPPPAKGQESPDAKASPPMVTRKRASGAGGLRPGGGSGQTEIGVLQMATPSKT
jgi:hypothetical protein